MIGLYDISTSQMHSNNLSTKTAIRSQASSEEIDQWLDSNINASRPKRQQRISSLNQSYQQQQQQLQQHNGTSFKRTSNLNNIDYYNNVRTSQSTKNSKNSSMSFIFDEHGAYNSSKAETSRQLGQTDYNQRDQNNYNVSEQNQNNSKYENEFLDANYTTYSRSKVSSKDYSFPIILAKDKLDDIQNLQQYKSRQFYDQTSSQPLQQVNVQKDDVSFQSQPQIHQIIDKQLLQNSQKTPNQSSYQKKKIEFLELNKFDSNNIPSSNSPVVELQTQKSAAVEPNKNNRIRSQIYQKKRQQFENIFGNDSQIQSNNQAKKEVGNSNGFSLLEREAYIDGVQVNKSYNSSPKSSSYNKNINIQQISNKLSKVDTSNSTQTQQKQPNNNNNNITHNQNNNNKTNLLNQKKENTVLSQGQSGLQNQDIFQFEQECFEEMHFFQVEFLQKCKSWMNQLESNKI